MKIICTQDEKENMTRALQHSAFCPFDDATYAVCDGKCSMCEMIEIKIEWVITVKG